MNNLRQQLNLTVADYARLIGCCPRSIRKWERGEIVNGPAQYIIAGILEATERHPEKRDAIIAFLQKSTKLGGLSYMITTLLERAQV